MAYQNMVNQFVLCYGQLYYNRTHEDLQSVNIS